MKTFCPMCEKETDCHFDAELYSCRECDEDFASYEKPQSTYWKAQAVASLKHILELTAFLSKIMLLGLLRGSPRLRDEALKLLDGIESSDIEGSVTHKL